MGIKEDITKIYVGYYDRAPDPDGLNYWIGRANAGMTLAEIANSFAVQTESTTKYPYLANPLVASADSFIDSVYMNLFNRAPDAAGKAYWLAELAGGKPVGQMIIDIMSGAKDDANGNDLTTLNNKVTAGVDWATDLANVSGLDYENNAAAKANAAAVLDGVTDDAATVTAAATATDTFVTDGAGVVGSTFTLTSGIDQGAAFVGGASNDTFNALDASPAAMTLTALDNIDGGAGTDTLNVTNSVAITIPGTATVANIEKANITTSAAITAADVSGWSGLTSLNTSSVGATSVTAAATTDVVSSIGSVAATATTISGGKDVTVTASGQTTGTVSATGGAGAVKVTTSGVYADGADNTLGLVTATGGTSIEVSATTGITAAQHTAATTDATNNTITQSDVDATGGATTTAITVSQDAAVTEVDSATAGKIGIVNGDIDVADKNAASATAAGTLTTVTLNSYGAGSSVNSGALSTLNLTGTGADLTVTTGALTTPVVDTLALNTNGLTTTGAVTIDADVKTLNVDSSTAKSTVASLVASGATALNVSGDQIFTATAHTAAALKTITVTNSAGSTFGSELATGVQFTGGAGVDTVGFAGTTKANNLGAGDDVATISTTTMGAGGSINGGDGTDTLVANTNGSAISGLPQITGFETLQVAGAAAQGTHNANGFTALEVGSLAGNATFTNVAANVGLTQLATMGADLTYTLADATGTADVVNVTLKSAGAIGADNDTITLAGVETVNITLTDTDTTAHVNAIELVATSAKSVNVSGNAGLVYHDADASITSFDATGVVLGKVTDTGVTYTSTNSTVAENVTIKGSNGVDVLTGSATANDTINGGDGADTIVYAGGGSDVFTGGAGNDTFDINFLGTSTVHATIADASTGDIIDLAGIAVGTGTYVATKIGLGAGATLAQYLDAASAGNGATNSATSWFQFGGDTYVVTDNTAGATFAATDGVVKVTGLVDLSTATWAAEALTLA